MGRPAQHQPESDLSVWNVEPDEPEPASKAWLQPLKAWQRWSNQRKVRKAQSADVQDQLRGVLTTQPESGRGQALRAAHRALRDRLNSQRALRRVLPHLYFIERALARQGSVALLETPVWVLQRGLHQLSRLPADNLAERVQLSVLQQRLVEAIRMRSMVARPGLGQAEAPDSFMGGQDSQMGGRSGYHTQSGGLEVSEVPRSVYEDLIQGTLPERDAAANHSGWYRS